MNSTNKIPLFFSFAGLVSSIILLIWVNWPQPQVERKFDVPGVEFFNLNSDMNEWAPMRLPEGIQAHLIIPERVWSGRIAEIELVIEPNFAPGFVVSEFLENHNLIAEARIDWPLMEITPKDVVSQPFGLSHSIRFIWHITPGMSAQAEGQFWFYLQLVSIETENMDRRALLSAPINIKTLSIMDMTHRKVQIVLLGVFGLSAFFFIRFFLNPGSRNRK